MKEIKSIVIAAIVVIGLTYFLTNDSLMHSSGDEHGHGHHGHEDPSEDEELKGPHGGRLLGDEEFQTEVTIYEPDIPPQSRVYFYENGELIDPSKVEFKMELQRIDRVDTFQYHKQGEYLIGDKVVEEPHSFEVKLYAKYKNKSYEWNYSSHEGRTELLPEAVRNAGIETEVAGSAKLKISTLLKGKVVPNDYRSLHVTPRFSGVVKEVKKELGDRVEKGDVLAVMESNESLSDYSVRSKISGTVIERNASPGEVLSEGESMYVIADLSSVWIDFSAYKKDLSLLQKGQKVLLHSSGVQDGEAEITYISPIGSADTQMFLVRAVVNNDLMHWAPGVYVTGEVIVEEPKVAVAVKVGALQIFRDWDVVFVQQGNLFEIAILELGRRDSEWVEVLSGLSAGARYVTKNSFVLKADVLKSGAGHNH